MPSKITPEVRAKVEELAGHLKQARLLAGEIERQFDLQQVRDPDWHDQSWREAIGLPNCLIWSDFIFETLKDHLRLKRKLAQPQDALMHRLSEAMSASDRLTALHSRLCGEFEKLKTKKAKGRKLQELIDTDHELQEFLLHDGAKRVGEMTSAL